MIIKYKEIQTKQAKHFLTSKNILPVSIFINSNDHSGAG